ncbi:general odorant-binding protein 83a-like [Uranotaenia lowii]|uniref:general odorant-binding protein 83a-like n=1 Tax=Uranotaenia lowii TaxID=190385 RepID=UPI002478860B|nr:general odorant-binding protein 83a-like [Uranotaenia lowii]
MVAFFGIGLALLALSMQTLAGPPPRRDHEYPPPSAVAPLKEVRPHCIQETGVSEAAIARFSDEDVFEDDEKLKCYMQCMFIKGKFTDANDEVDLMKILDSIPPNFEAIYLGMGSKCTKPKGKTQCDRAFWYHKCWKMADPVHYYLV